MGKQEGDLRVETDIVENFWELLLQPEIWVESSVRKKNWQKNVREHFRSRHYKLKVVTKQFVIKIYTRNRQKEDEYSLELRKGERG